MKLRLELVLLVQLLLLNLFASFRLFFSLTNSRLFLTPLCPFPCSMPMQICGAFFAVRDRCHKAKRPERLLCLCLCLCLSLSRSLFANKYFVASIWYCADSLAMSTSLLLLLLLSLLLPLLLALPSRRFIADFALQSLCLADRNLFNGQGRLQSNQKHTHRQTDYTCTHTHTHGFSSNNNNIRPSDLYN